MDKYNRILLQLNTAINLSNSDMPQEKAMAVILFDNIIELQIYKRVDRTLSWDETTWRSGNRSYNKKEREEVIGPRGKYDRLLKLASDESIISSNELEIIKFAHEIRNGIYHRGEEDKFRLDLAILIYYSFILNKFKKWGHPEGIIRISDLPEDKQINFGQSIQSDPRALVDNKKYFESSLDAIFSKWKVATNLSEKAFESISYQIENIRYGLNFIKRETSKLNFYGALERYWYLNNLFSDYSSKNRKPRDIDNILLLSLYLRENKDYLDDIPELEIRQKEGRKLLRDLRKKYKGKYPYWTDLERIEQRIKTFKGKDEHVIIKNLIDIQNKINNLFLDVDNTTLHLDGYIQELMDWGK